MSGHFGSTALQAVEGGLIDVLMYGVNLVHHDNAGTKALLRTCAERNVGVVAMKPFYGGTLLNYDGRPTSITPVQCLTYTLSQPVATAIPGVRNVEELQAALRTLEGGEAERDWQAAIPYMHHSLAGHCVRCNHCLPCPVDMDIGQTILCVGFAQWEGVTDLLRGWYAALPAKASACIECGVCEERCPFDVEIIAKMHRAVELYES
jgi:predicted aldo/keto reductase-like oxidoreductase